MSTLEDFQKRILDVLLAGEKTDSGLDIYRTIIAENHNSALSDTYPVCEQLVGSDYFKVLAWNYLRTYPTGEPDLNLYGKDFPIFLFEWFTKHSPYIELLYLKDIAAIEWAMYFLPLDQGTDEMTVEVECNALDIWKAHQGEFVEIEKKEEQSLIILRHADGQTFAKSIPRESSI